MNAAPPTPGSDNAQPAAGWLLYDGDCGFCTRTARQAERLIARRGFAILPLQTPWVRERLGLNQDELLREMIVLRRDNRRFGGADAAVHLAGEFWWGRPLVWLAAVPGVRPLMRRIYAEIAARRSCLGGACALDAHRHHGHPTDWLPLALIPASLIAVATATQLEPWIYMWLLAAAIFAGCKWLTWRRGRRAFGGAAVAARRSLGYLFAWPGMDATRFLAPDPAVARPPTREWIFATAKVAGGAALIWLGVRTLPGDASLLAGWVGMTGIIFVLHFGVFHLLSLAWRRTGVNAAPLMRAPILARSLAEFWGRRWNAAFNELAHRLVFRRAARVWNAVTATVLVFAGSGVLHDLVISLPARGGFGRPTAYFLIQGVAVLAERSRPGRWLGLGHGVIGWLFTLLVVAGPAGLLFHAPFVHRVILPMLRAIGAC